MHTCMYTNICIYFIFAHTYIGYSNYTVQLVCWILLYPPGNSSDRTKKPMSLFWNFSNVSWSNWTWFAEPENLAESNLFFHQGHSYDFVSFRNSWKLFPVFFLQNMSSSWGDGEIVAFLTRSSIGWSWKLSERVVWKRVDISHRSRWDHD